MRLKVSVTRLIILATFLALIEVACRIGLIERATLLPPTEMLASAWNLLFMPPTYAAIAWTLTNAFGAIALSLSIGVPAGVLIHRHPAVRSAVDPFLASYYAVPFFIFYPILVGILGFNRWPLIVIGFLFSVPAVISSVLDGLDKVRPIFQKIGRVFQMGQWNVTVRLILPAMAPAIFTGVKLCVAYGFIAIIVSEFILSNQGLGFRIKDAYEKFNAREMYGMLLIALAFIIVINMIVRHVERSVRRRWEA